jgi:hypothetical protein
MRATAAHGVTAGLDAIRRYFLRTHEEAILRTLDKRLLADIGFEPVIENDIKIDDTCRRAEFVPLWEAFSLTRFGK